MRFWRQ